MPTIVRLAELMEINIVAFCSAKVRLLGALSRKRKSTISVFRWDRISAKSHCR